MAEAFLSLAARDRKDILESAAAQLGRPAFILEKDIWLCWVLQTLFSIPCHHPMVFKGGTSLSKVYGIIDRFSEDVDITLDYKTLRLRLRSLRSGRQQVTHQAFQPMPQILCRRLSPGRRRARPGGCGCRSRSIRPVHRQDRR